MNPRVSICIPAFKQVNLLRKVLDSIRIQTFTDFELIITDDTPDNSVEQILKEFDFNTKLQYYHNSKSFGSPTNWNYAISLAKGEYIKILHTDDFFTSPQSLEKYVKLLDNNPNANFGFSASEVLNIATNEKQIYSCSPKHLQELKTDPNYLFFRNVIGGPSATIYRRSLDAVYDTDLKWLVDIDFYMMVLNKNMQVAYCPEPLICTSDGAEGQITTSLINDKYVQIREHIILFTKIQKRDMTIKNEKYLLFFKLLFNKFNIRSMGALKAIIQIPSEQEDFFSRVITAITKGMIITRLKVRFYNSSLNKNILKMEIF